MRLHSAATCVSLAILAGASFTLPRFPGAASPASPYWGPDTVRWQSPEEQLRGFRVPPGFEVQLVAAEPDIGKPLNLAFDAQGRLWVAHTTEYPFAAAEGQGRDRVTIVEDLDGDGRGDRFTDVASDLNIPTGVLPLEDGALVFSIPHVYRLHDRDGDGRADSRSPLYGPFGYDDTHGMVNSLVQAFDGWIYAGHGYNNTSAVAGTDGDTVRMFSGNTFRFRTDGSRIEQMTWGRVNPFGLFVDRLGYFYSSDSHTRPIYQLIRSAEYPHFARQPENIGFGPMMMQHLHGSTAIAGVVLYQADQFPAEYRDNFFGGNVVTNRINRNRLVWHGSTPEAVEEPDFLISEDPNFRPVDVELGPDGALYIADFYNPIIGHYEAPLGDPGRDRTSGRIWRIVYRGPGGNPAVSPLRPGLSVAELVDLLAHPNIVVRMTATHTLVERGSSGSAVAPAARRLLNARRSSSEQRVHSLWILHRLGVLRDAELRAASRHPDEALRVHATRVLAERERAGEFELTLARAALRDPSPHVRRAAAEVLGRSPSVSHLRPLLDLHHTVPAGDTHLVHTVRIALRDQLAEPAVLQHARVTAWAPDDARALAFAASGVPSAEAARLLLEHVQRHEESPNRLGHYLRQIARVLPAAEADPLVALIQREFAESPETQLDLYGIAAAGVAARGERPTEPMRAWGAVLARRFLNPDADWGATPANEVNARRVRAAAIAAELRLGALEPLLLNQFADAGATIPVRLAAGRALLEMAPDRHLTTVAAVLGDGSAPAPLREQLVNPLARAGAEAQRHLAGALDRASPRLREKIVFALAGTPAGAEQLLDAVETGLLDHEALTDPTLRERLLAGKPEPLGATLHALLARIESDEARREDRVAAHLAAFPGRGSAARGALAFATYCGACHQVAGVGGQVGPELDGIGNRTPAELIAKIIDPNRSVAPAFRYHTIILNNGDVITGLPVREQGVGITFIDREGQEVTIQKQQIAERRVSPFTLMPSNFDAVIPAEELYDLVSYLLTLR